ncbi:hypothetical protein [Actinoplanes philippinensis]|uniref:hypothetical protein n=1 Tax=Actinoplanes philippinensis TaxID=35752 RepID=UPI0033C7028C
MTNADGGTVDYELEMWARTVLIGSSEPRPYDKVRAYRILARVNPHAYQAHLVKALLEFSYRDGRRSSAPGRLTLLEEMATAVRAVPAGEHRRGELAVHALGAYQRDLYALGRRAEGLAVRTEMAAACRLALAAGDRGWVEWGLRTWAHGLAEEGRHDEAAAALTELLDVTLPEDNWGTTIWDRLSLIAELEAAGRTGEAITRLSTLLDEDRVKMATDRTSLGDVFRTLIWHARLLDHAGRRDDAGAARHEALGLLRRLAATGEPQNWSGGQYTSAGVLLAVQARDAEPHTTGRPRPALGVAPTDWSPDLRERYFDESGLTRCGAPAVGRPGTLLDRARREPDLAERAALRRRVAIRTGVYGLWHHGHRFLEPTLPAFHNSVDAARQLHSHAPGGRPALAHALTDRTVILIAGHRYAEALDDYQEALALA